MNVYICSNFRNSVRYLERFFDQMAGLQMLLHERGDFLFLLLGYGDSTDGTGEALWDETMLRFSTILIENSHGGPEFGPVVDAQRFKQLAYAANKVWRCVPPTADVVLWCESDLIWQPDTLLALILHTARYPVIAPMVLEPGGLYYDIWGYVKDGQEFCKLPPFHPALYGQMTQMDSVGSCFAVRGDLARRTDFPEEDVVRGFCRQVYERDASVWLDPSLAVYHP